MKQITRSMTRMVALMFAVATFAASAPELNAQQPQQGKSGLSMSFKNLTLTRDSARARRSKANEVAANDTLRFSLVFANNEGKELRNVTFENPMPAHLQLMGGTVTTSAPAKVEYSIDGGVTFSAQPMVNVLENGRQIPKPATPESYTHIRWTIRDEIAPGARVTAQFDTRVAPRPSPRPAAGK